MPSERVVKALRAFPSDGDVLAVWRPWFEGRGVRLPCWDSKIWVYLPSAEPPKQGAIGGAGGSMSDDKPAIPRGQLEAARTR